MPNSDKTPATAHTPTPWEAVELPDGIYIRQKAAPGILACIVETNLAPSSSELLAALSNAELIVRAVNSHDKLLAASKALLAWLEEFYPDEPLFSAAPNHANTTVNELRAAIAEADHA